MPDHEPDDQRRAQRIEELVEQIAALPDAHVREQAEELIQALLALYGDGLARILELTASSDSAGDALIARLGDDPLVGALLVLHGLHPLSLETRLERAVDTLQPMLAVQGGALTVSGVSQGIAHLRLEAARQGQSHGCGAPSTAALKQSIEESLYAAVPDLEGLQVEGNVEPARLITLTPTRRKPSISGANAHPTPVGQHTLSAE